MSWWLKGANTREIRDKMPPLTFPRSYNVLWELFLKFTSIQYTTNEQTSSVSLFSLFQVLCEFLCRIQVSQQTRLLSQSPRALYNRLEIHIKVKLYHIYLSTVGIILE
jgi:hypothetical protein